LFVFSRKIQEKVHVHYFLCCCFQKSALNEYIYTIEATDQDSGRNAEIVYSLEKENDWQSFLLDPVTGELTNKAVLDRETHPVYVVST